MLYRRFWLVEYKHYGPLWTWKKTAIKGDG